MCTHWPIRQQVTGSAVQTILPRNLIHKPFFTLEAHWPLNKMREVNSFRFKKKKVFSLGFLDLILFVFCKQQKCWGRLCFSTVSRIRVISMHAFLTFQARL